MLFCWLCKKFCKEIFFNFFFKWWMLVMFLIKKGCFNRVKFWVGIKYLNFLVLMCWRIKLKENYFKCCLLFVENLFCLVNDFLNRYIILKWNIDGRLYIIFCVVFKNKFVIGFKYILKFLIGNIWRNNVCFMFCLFMFDIFMNLKFFLCWKEILI